MCSRAIPHRAPVKNNNSYGMASYARKYRDCAYAVIPRGSSLPFHGGAVRTTADGDGASKVPVERQT